MRLLIGRSLLASFFVLASVSYAHAQGERCMDVHARLTTQFGACPSDFSSPIGLCSSGTLTSFFERAHTRFRAQTAAYSAGLTGVEPATTLSYGGDFELTDSHGSFLSSDVGLSDTANSVFTEISRIKSGTGRYAHATGVLFISGVSTANGVDFTADVTGKICF